MSGLVFENRAPVVASAPNRADIACFVGFVRRRRNQKIPSEIRSWLCEQGWISPPYQRQSEEIEDLLDLPVPLDSWEIFDRLFAWERRRAPVRSEEGSSYMGAAVRSFFAQGGRKCYVIRVGNPWTILARRDKRQEQIQRLIPGYPQRIDVSAVDRRGWRGIGHLFGLPDVSFLCLPDLADAVGMHPRASRGPAAPPPGPEQFVECSEPVAPPPKDRRDPLFRAPRCDEEGYKDWALALRLTADLLARQQREIQLVAAVPIPHVGTVAERDLLEFLTDQCRKYLALHPSGQREGLASAFVQLAYPWLRSPGSTNLPERLESPDAVLVGILARNALLRGTFRSAANLHLADVYDVSPSLSSHQLRPQQHNSAERGIVHSLLERVSLFGPTPSGLRLLSDVTTSLDESYRPASVNRLVSVIVRAARRLGETIIFESSGERLWASLRESLNSLLFGLLQAGALRGATAREAFHVRCDRSTMSQNDIDNGRIIVHIEFEAAASIEQITVVLAMDEGGQVSLLSTDMVKKEAA